MQSKKLISSDFICRELFIERENATVQEQPLDCEANSYFACKKCGQVI